MKSSSQKTQYTRSSSLLHLVSRLFIGSLESGAEGIINRLHKLESELEESLTGDASGSLSRSYNINQEAGTSPDHLRMSDSKGAEENLRYAVLGLVFRSQEKISHGLSRVDRLSTAAFRLASPLTQRIYNSRLATPVRKRYERLVERGEQEVSKLIQHGKQEEQYSRALVDKTLDTSIDTWIEGLTTNPDVMELVQKQSAGLATEVVEEVRERTISADTFLESLARALLRKTPRSRLPGPPMAIRSRARSAGKADTKQKHKLENIG